MRLPESCNALEQSLGIIKTTKTVYDKILGPRIANSQIVNYAACLEKNKYFEDSVKVRIRFSNTYFPIANRHLALHADDLI